uniref:UDP-glucose/GDP-mannose dehydrogenase family protein n=1 Tax=Rhizobium sp. TaxID=391 RepID=UPI0034C68141
KGFTVIVTKSTVPVGTGDEVERIVRETNPQADVAIVSNPEFLREGAAIEDFKRPDRIVIGLNDERARGVMTEVYRPLYLNQAPLLFTSRRTSELIKYAANAFLAMKITFINEMADLCEKVGANVQEVSRGIGLDGRIGSKFLHAGPGYGGSCFPKDTLALAKTAQDYDSPVRLIETTVSINDNRKRAMGRKVIAAMGGDIRGKAIAVLGLTFKPNTDDMRDSPAISIIQTLQDAGATVTGYDPEGMDNARLVIDNIAYAEDAYSAARDADALVIVTEWNQFRALDFARLKSIMKAPVLVDLRNIYRHDEVTKHGFAYTSVGRPSSDATL